MNVVESKQDCCKKWNRKRSYNITVSILSSLIAALSVGAVYYINEIAGIVFLAYLIVKDK